MSEKKIAKHFKEKNIAVKQDALKIDKRTQHFVTTGKEDNPTVVFVHGSPGSLSAFIDFLSDSLLLSRAHLVTIDRPGFGYSNFGKAEPSLKMQAALLQPLLELRKQHRPIILVGHSLGGPVIARMAMDYPDLVDGLIIVAGSIDPELEPNERWFRVPLATPFFSWLMPLSFKASNDEILETKKELELMLPLWKDIKCPVIILHGMKDKLVPPGNADFAKRMLTNTSVDVVLREDVNHFIPWTHPEMIQQAILQLLGQFERNGLAKQ
ncbi:alpha/beta hydrolase [Chryseotalea sanaruensis]|uniref:Alpha/beta hydrolase n=2 Tax=Chryseotalea sanaruensis TaxID=2482724 RepID=A0A401U9U4_9BACT|nr:alpha/beta hydrolase [Chryseotalea sanaruensis]